MPGIIGHKSVKHRKSRRTNNSPATATPIVVTDIDTTAAKVTLTFDQAISVSGIPGYFNDLGALPVGASALSATSIELTYPAGPIATVIIPFQDPAVRNSTGGYVNPGDHQTV